MIHLRFPVSYTHLDVYKRQAEMEVESPVKAAVPEEKPEVPIYRETATYAYEADELESYLSLIHI